MNKQAAEDCPNCETTRSEMAALKRHHESVLKLVSPLLQPLDYEEASSLEKMLRRKTTKFVSLPTVDGTLGRSGQPSPKTILRRGSALVDPSNLDTIGLPVSKLPMAKSLQGTFEEGEQRAKNVTKDAQKVVESKVEDAKKLAEGSVSQVRSSISQLLSKATLPFLLTGIAGAGISGPLTFISPYAAYLGPLTAVTGIIGLVTMLRSNAERAVKEKITGAEKTVASLAAPEKFVEAAAAKGQIRDFLNAGGWVEKTASGEQWRLCTDCGKRHGPFRGH